MKITENRNYFFLPLLAIACFFSENSIAQIAADTLQEVKVLDQKNISNDDKINSFSPGQKIISFDSTILKQYDLQNVANLLSQQSTVFVKSYGLNGLATLNFRGSSAAQSQVYWDGIPIQNAALGIADVSLLPVAMIQDLHIVYGSSSSLLGSGNVGGALLLESEAPVFTKQKTDWQLTLGAGSFGQYQTSLKIRKQQKKWFFSNNIFYQQAKNDFSYKDDFGTSVKTTNAQLEGLAILPQIAFKANEKNVFKLVGWYQKYYREIPASLFESYSVKNRNDESLRLLFDWKRTGVSSSTYLRTSISKEEMRYDDEASLQHVHNKSYQYFFEAGWNKRFESRHQLMVFAPIQLGWMQSLDSKKYQSKYALVAAYRYNSLSEKLDASISVREELFNERFIFLPGINASYRFSKNFLVRGNIQKTYRTPTLNELYYEPGGNKELKPEKGWAEEIGYGLHTKTKTNIILSHDVSFFNRVIDDWIIWLGGAIWTPHNIASVHSRGIETENRMDFPINKITFHTGFTASYILSTTTSSYLPNDGSIGKQIPYTPKCSRLINVGVTWGNLYLNYNYKFTGLRYVNTDESDLVKSYSISNIYLRYDWQIKNNVIGCSLQLNNVFNEEYQVVKSRPMPGRAWLFGVLFAKK